MTTRLFTTATANLEAKVILGEWREGVHEEAAEKGITLPEGGPDVMLALKKWKGIGWVTGKTIPRRMMTEIRRRSGLTIEELNSKLGLPTEQKCFYKMPYGTCKTWNKVEAGWARTEQYGLGPVMDRSGASRKIYWEEVAEYAGKVLGGEWVVESAPGCHAAIRRIG